MCTSCTISILNNNKLNAVPPAHQSVYEVADGRHDLVARTCIISSYCGVYECVENNGAGPGRASATVTGSLSFTYCASFYSQWYMHSTAWQ